MGHSRYIFRMFLLCSFFMSLIVDSGLFMSPGQSFQHAFCAGTCLLALGGLCICGRNDIRGLSVLAPAGILSLYIIAHHWLLPSPDLALRKRYLFACTVFPGFLAIVFSSLKASVRCFLVTVQSISAVEVCVCIAQYAGWTVSDNPYFCVTGTFVNPNVTAMFLALTVPAWTVYCTQAGRKVRKIAGVGMLMLLVTIQVWLRCRTALMGTAVALVSVTACLYKWPAALYFHGSALKKTLAALLTAVLFILLSAACYTVKKGSADARVEIWSESVSCALKSPVLGHGYGQAERVLHLARAERVSQGKATAFDLKAAEPVNTVYNDYLETCLEGGLVHAVLWFGWIIAVLFCFLKSTRQRKHLTGHEAAACGGVLALLSMSLTNFCTSPIVAATGLSWLAVLLQRHIRMPGRRLSVPAFIPLALLCGYLAAGQVRFTAASIEMRRLYTHSDHLSSYALQVRAEHLRPLLQHSDTYWCVLAKIHERRNEWDKAVGCIRQGLAYTAFPSVSRKNTSQLQRSDGVAPYHERHVQRQEYLHHHRPACPLYSGSVRLLSPLRQLFSEPDSLVGALHRA